MYISTFCSIRKNNFKIKPSRKKSFDIFFQNTFLSRYEIDMKCSCSPSTSRGESDNVGSFKLADQNIEGPEEVPRGLRYPSLEREMLELDCLRPQSGHGGHPLGLQGDQTSPS